MQMSPAGSPESLATMELLIKCVRLAFNCLIVTLVCIETENLALQFFKLAMRT